MSRDKDAVTEGIVELAKIIERSLERQCRQTEQINKKNPATRSEKERMTGEEERSGLFGRAREVRAYGENTTVHPTIERKRIMDAKSAAKSAAKSIANTPTHVVVAGIQTIRNALDTAEAVINSGATDAEKTADNLLAALETRVPTLVEPVVNLLDLSAKPTP